MIMKNNDGCPSWRDFQLLIMEEWFRLDADRECYGLVFDGVDTEEIMRLAYI